MSAPKKDATGCLIVIGVSFGIGALLLGMAIEILKFIALVKWVFS